MKHRCSWQAAAILLALILSYPDRAFAREEDHWDKTTELTPFTTTALNSCNTGEPVDLTGVASVKTWSRVIDGTFFFRQNIRITGAGRGQVSGAVYRIEEKNHVHIFDGLPLPFLTSQRSTLRLLGKGVPDQIIQIENRFEVDVNGNVITDFLDINVVCR